MDHRVSHGLFRVLDDLLCIPLRFPLRRSQQSLPDVPSYPHYSYLRNSSNLRNNHPFSREIELGRHRKLVFDLHIDPLDECVKSRPFRHRHDRQQQ